MPSPKTTHTPIQVAVGVIVENMSSLASLRPPELSAKQLRAADRSALRALIARRKREQVLGGYWELPGGKIETDESAAHAVERELFEEIGIRVRPVIELQAVEHVYDHAHVRLLPFVCCRVEGHPRAIEVDEVRWVGLDELDSYRFPDASLPVIDAARRALGVMV